MKAPLHHQHVSDAVQASMSANDGHHEVVDSSRHDIVEKKKWWGLKENSRSLQRRGLNCTATSLCTNVVAVCCLLSSRKENIYHNGVASDVSTKASVEHVDGEVVSSFLTTSASSAFEDLVGVKVSIIVW